MPLCKRLRHDLARIFLRSEENLGQLRLLRNRWILMGKYGRPGRFRTARAMGYRCDFIQLFLTKKITPNKRALPLIADQKAFGSVPGPFAIILFLWFKYTSHIGLRPGSKDASNSYF